MDGAMGDRAPMSNLATPLTLRRCKRNRRLAGIPPDEDATENLASPPFMSLGASLVPRLERGMPLERPPTQLILPSDDAVEEYLSDITIVKLPLVG